MNAIDLVSLTNGNPTVESVNHSKIEKAAHEFEGMLLGSLWKSMGDDMKSSLDDDSTGSSFIDMGLEAVGSAMAKSGGLGIGRMLLKALEKQQSAESGEVHGPK